MAVSFSHFFLIIGAKIEGWNPRHNLRFGHERLPSHSVTPLSVSSPSSARDSTFVGFPQTPNLPPHSPEGNTEQTPSQTSELVIPPFQNKEKPYTKKDMSIMARELFKVWSDHHEQWAKEVHESTTEQATSGNSKSEDVQNWVAPDQSPIYESDVEWRLSDSMENSPPPAPTVGQVGLIPTQQSSKAQLLGEDTPDWSP